jgi:hypothetical protein
MTVKGWNAEVTGVGALDGGRAKLELTGQDGQKRNVFLPAGTLPALVASLVGLSATLAKKTGGPDALAGKHMMGLKSFTIGSDDSGQEFALALTTIDGLELAFQLDGRTAEALTAGLVSTLEKHGRSPSLLRSQRPKH